MHFSLSAVTAALLLTSSVPLALVSASADAEPKLDTAPDSTPTKAAAQQQVRPRETTPNLLSALYQIANNFGLRACIPQALPLVTTLPRIPPGLLMGGAVSQALAQTTRELEDVCEFSVTGSVGDTFTSFLPTWYEWYSKHSERIQSVVTKCPKAGKLVSTVEAYRTCPQVVAQITAAGTSETATATTATTAIESSETETETETETGAETEMPSAAHDTGFLGGCGWCCGWVVGGCCCAVR